jgi:hypothetical protein
MIVMRRWALLLTVSVLGTAGCAAVFGGGRPDPQALLHEGVAAVEARQYLRARALLEPLYQENPADPVAQRAMIVLIAAELDNRNPDRRLWAAADMAGRLLSVDDAEPWVLPVAASYYLLALELGAAEQRVAQAEARAAEARAAEARAANTRRLPTSARESVPAQMGRVTTERDQARRRAEQLEQQLATRERELRETRQELDRIRRTIRP